MYVALLVIGIVITSIAITAITVFSISNFIVKKINRKERESMSDDEKRREKLFSRSLKWLKRVLKLINKNLLENLWAFYGIATVSLVGGVSMMVVGAVQENKHQQEMASSTSEAVSSSFVGNTSSTISFSTNITSTSSSLEESSELSTVSSLSSIETSSSNTTSLDSTFSSNQSISSSESSQSSIEPTISSSTEQILYHKVTFLMGEAIEWKHPDYAEYQQVADGDVATYKTVEGEVVRPIVWYIDYECNEGNNYDFSSPVVSDITLYAGY